MTQFILNLLDDYIKIGGREEDFWDMSIQSISREFDGYNYRETRRLKEQTALDYSQAMLIVKGVGICMGSKQQMPTLYETYPELYREEAEKEKLARDRASIVNFMNSFNRRYE